MENILCEVVKEKPVLKICDFGLTKEDQYLATLCGFITIFLYFLRFLFTERQFSWYVNIIQ
jgi:hypothetical protein